MIASRGSAQFQFRLPEGMRNRLKEVAAENRRSMNSELVCIVERALFDPLKNPEKEKGAAPA